MKVGRYLTWWASGVVFGVFVTLSWHFLSQPGPVADLRPPDASALTQANPPVKKAETQRAKNPERITASSTQRQAAKSLPKTLRSSVGKPPVSAKAEPVDPPALANSLVATAGTLPPAPIVMKPLGYVERANGQVEAIISDEDEVYVIHEGETVADKYKVLKISRTAVEVADLTRQQPTPSPFPSPVAGRETLLATASKLPVAIAPLKGVLGTDAQREAAIGPEPVSVSPSNSIGFVETASGQVQKIVADGEHVRLEPDVPVLTANLRPVKRPVGESKVKLKLEQSVTERSDAVVDAAASLGPGPHAHRPQLPQIHPVAMGALEAELSRGSGRGEVSPPVSKPSPYQVDSADSVTTSQTTATAGRQIVADHLLTSGTPVTLNTIGYVERSKGQIEAIVSEGDAVYLVREGEVFADRFRALRVSPTVVEAVEISPELPLTPPATGPPSGQMLAMESKEDVPGRAPPAGPIQTVALAQADVRAGPDPPTLKTPRLADQSAPDIHVRSAGSGEIATQTRPEQSPSEVPRATGAPAPTLIKPLGYVERAGGKVEAIVERDSEVFLVRKGEIFADKYRVLRVSASAVEMVEVLPQQAHQTIAPVTVTLQGQLASTEPLEAITHSPPLVTSQVENFVPLRWLSSYDFAGIGTSFSGLGGATGGFNLHSNGAMADNPRLAR